MYLYLEQIAPIDSLSWDEYVRKSWIKIFLFI